MWLCLLLALATLAALMLQPQPYTWGLTHRAWNHLIHALHGNGAAAAAPAAAKRPKALIHPSAPRDGEHIAFCSAGGPHGPGWYCAKVETTEAVPPCPRFPMGLATAVWGQLDGTKFVFCPLRTTWRKHWAAREIKPKCPKCGSEGTTKWVNCGGPKPGRGASPDARWICGSCDARLKGRHPAHLARGDQAGPHIITQPFVVGDDTAAGPPMPQGPAMPKPPPKQQHTYRDGAGSQPCLGDATLGYANMQGLGEPGAARAFVRDVALQYNDITAVSEAGNTEADIEGLRQRYQPKGHRVWGAANVAGTKNQNGTGTLFIVRSTIPSKPGEGLVYAKPDGKAAAVALMIVDHPVIILAAHLPADGRDSSRVPFLDDLTAGLGAAIAEHQQSAHGAAWANARWLWAGDLNLTLQAEDDELAQRVVPGPDAVAALDRLNQLMGGAVDLYRTQHPLGRRYTHGKAGSRRHLDKWFAPPSHLQGDKGVVALKHVEKELLGFSYVRTRDRRERYKVPDHDMVQVVYRPTTFRAPPAKPMIRVATLYSREMRRWVSERLHTMWGECGGGGAGDESHACETAFDRLHTELLETCVQRQRRLARQNGKKKAKLLSVIKRLRATLDGLQPGQRLDATESALKRRCRQLQAVGHTARRARDAEEELEAQREAEGAGKAARIVTKPTPVTRLDVPDGPKPHESESPPVQHTTQKAVADASTRYWSGFMQGKVEPSAEAALDRDEVLAKLQRDTAGKLPQRVLDALSIEQIIDAENIKVAIADLAANSTPGTDSMPLALYMSHREEMAPLLRRLYSELLRKGRLSETMRQTILSPIFKDKGFRHEAKRYRPISVTTMEYRILTKCIAQRLNKAIAFLVGDAQTGFYPGRKYDENILLVRSTVRDINERRSEDGGLILFLDNEKAFDRVQHDFMFKTLEAFNLPSELVGAVRTLYRAANTSVKTNGEIGPTFEQTSGVKQGCPLSPLLYLLVQEVQLKMIRENDEVDGIPIPGHDGQDPTTAAATATVKERGLVDDTMVCLRSPASVAPLLRTLSRFEAFSNHKMNVDKTLLLLLGRHRDFDLGGGTTAARLLRGRGVTPGQVHDVSKEGANLPEKWHGVLLGGEAGTAATWDATARRAKHASDAHLVSALPYASRGRLAQASGKIMGVAKAALMFTVPHSQKTIDSTLERVQKAADSLVLGRRHAIAAAEARQPRSSFGIGLLDVKSYMEAAWLQPLLSTLACPEQRPYKHYMAQAARLGYPELGAGREMLSLNLSFDRVAQLPPSDVTGEVRQAFRALGALPPLRYREPEQRAAGAGEPTAERREAMSADDLRRQLLFFNPLLAAEPMERRATREEEEEMLQWAAVGVTRVAHVLDTRGGVMRTGALLAKYPALLGLVPSKGNITKRLKALRDDLSQWEDTLRKKPPKRVKGGEWWAQSDGTLLRAGRSATSRDAEGETPTGVPATVYIQQPHTGWITATTERRRLPALRALSSRCHVRTTVDVDWSECDSCANSQGNADSGSDDDDMPQAQPELPQGTPRMLDSAIATDFRQQLLAPPGAPPVVDARLLEWETRLGKTRHSTTCVEGARARDARLTFTAQRAVDPRVFAQGGRFEGMVAGLTDEERERRIATIAEGLSHWAIPCEERLHLQITAHHGHTQGAKKCKGDMALCAACLKRGRRVEETAQHEHHDCPELAHKVWRAIAKEWLRTTGEELDVSDPLVTVMGMRGLPREEAEKREAAWRLLHGVVLLQLHRARNRVHAAMHAKTPYEPRRTSAHHVLHEVRRRTQRQLDLIHLRARHAAENGATRQNGRGTMAEFQHHWITSGMATFSKHGPRLALFRQRPGPPAPPPGVHVRVTGAVVPATRRQAHAAGYALEASDVAADGSASLRLRARGAVQSVSTHATSAPAHAPTRITEQVAQHAAVGEALAYAEQLLAANPSRQVTIMVASSTTLHHLTADVSTGGARQDASGAGASHAATNGSAQPGASAPQHMTGRQRLDMEKRNSKRPRRGRDGSLAAASGQAASDDEPDSEEDGPSAQRQRVDQRSRGAKRGREEPSVATTTKHGPAYQSQSLRNREKLAALRSKYPARVQIQTPPEAITSALLRQARSAARLEDGNTRVSTPATSREVSVHQWTQIRTWDPGD